MPTAEGKESIEKSMRNHKFNEFLDWAESEAINLLLGDHEEAIGDWKYQELAKKLYHWAGVFNFEFKLKLSHPVVGFEKLRCTTLACYEDGRSEFGTRFTIVLNILYLHDPLYRILRRLLHECIHLWQELYGKPASRSTYHNRQFIEKAQECGILTNSSGHDLGHNKIFSSLLLKYGVDAPETEGRPSNEREPEDGRAKGTSKIKKWSCGCTNVWCAVELHAQCLECGNDFKKEEK